MQTYKNQSITAISSSVLTIKPKSYKNMAQTFFSTLKKKIPSPKLETGFFYRRIIIMPQLHSCIAFIAIITPLSIFLSCFE
jgi:hypothetical protein